MSMENKSTLRWHGNYVSLYFVYTILIDFDIAANDSIVALRDCHLTRLAVAVQDDDDLLP